MQTEDTVFKHLLQYINHLLNWKNLIKESDTKYKKDFFCNHYMQTEDTVLKHLLQYINHLLNWKNLIKESDTKYKEEKEI